MLQFIVTNVLLLSVGTTLYLVIRALPRLEEGGQREERGMWERWIASEIPERIDRVLRSVFLKLLRRSKIAILKVDNTITKRLEKMKEEPRKGKLPVGFKQMVESKTEKENNTGS